MSLAAMVGLEFGRVAGVDRDAREDFYRLAKEVRAKEGQNFDPKRFFSDEDELLHFGGRNFAFSSQWCGSDWMHAVIKLRDAFPDQEIEFAPSE